MIEYMKELDKEIFLKFLEENWNINHIYLKDQKYFAYEFSDNSNFILAKKDNKIVATLGYFDYDNKGDIWTVIWKNAGKMDDGLKCLKFLLNAGYKSVSSCGINKKTIPIYEFLGINTGRLKHFYILNYFRYLNLKTSIFCFLLLLNILLKQTLSQIIYSHIFE